MVARLPLNETAGLPLASIDAVVLDLETTGLNTKEDRVIEFGAVRIESGILSPDASFSCFIDPQQPIPESSTRIHGIIDQHVAGAARFRTGFEQFSAWAGPRLYIGYSFWFDLAVLAAESSRCNLVWQEPRSLDVEALVRVLRPDLPDTSLETVAAWLGLAIENRHRALDDARLTAEVFQRLVPKLHKAGVTSVGQAERACRVAYHRSGGEPRTGIPSKGNVSVVDSFIYRQRVQDLMSSDLLIIKPDVTVSDALARLVANRAGSILVEPEGRLEKGILTEKDLIQAFGADRNAAFSQPIGRYCSRPLLTIHRKEFVYRAIITMQEKQIRHLGVVDDSDRVVGVVSARDVFARYTDNAAGFGQEIVAAQSAAELGRVWLGLTTVVRSLAAGGVDARTITAIISRELRALTARACILSERNLEANGNEISDTGYAMLVLGSGGRGESLLAMDQDNAIVHVKNDAEGHRDRILSRLAGDVSKMLDEVGVSLCDGGVMASNPEWRRDARGWCLAVQHWVNRSRPEDLLSSDIFFDAMPVHGNFRLAHEVRTQAMSTAQASRMFLRLLAMRATDFKAPRRLFGLWRLDRGRIDLKKGGIMPIFSAARVLALEHGLHSRSTAHRLYAFKALNIVSEPKIDDLVTAHGMLLGQILQQQLRDLERGFRPSNSVAPHELDTYGRQQLNWSVEQLRLIPDLLGTPAQF